MPAPAITTHAKSDAAEAAGTAEPERSRFDTSAAEAEHAGDQGAGAPPHDQDEPSSSLDALTLFDISGPHARAAGGDASALPALLSLQHAELDRLAHSNARLMAQIDVLLQMQAREQAQRQSMQDQLQRIGEQLQQSAPARDLEAVRREARAGVTEELKPVLLAVIDALERVARKSAGDSEAAPELSEFGHSFSEDFGKLPEILTRPLEELVAEGSRPDARGDGRSNRRPPGAPLRHRGRTAPRPTQQTAGGAAPFTWTTVFSS